MKNQHSLRTLAAVFITIGVFSAYAACEKYGKADSSYIQACNLTGDCVNPTWLTNGENCSYYVDNTGYDSYCDCAVQDRKNCHSIPTVTIMTTVTAHVGKCDAFHICDIHTQIGPSFTTIEDKDDELCAGGGA